VSAARPSERLPLEGRIVAFDLGDVRIGVAVSDPDQVIASPDSTLATEDDTPELLVPRLAAELVRHGAVGAVVGDPRALDGSSGERSRRARLVASALEDASGLPVVLWDERFTTSEAERVLVAADVSRRGRREVVDRVAASVLLQAVLGAQARRREARR
jgi:putative Holliday junction resolvase